MVAERYEMTWTEAREVIEERNGTRRSGAPVDTTLVENCLHE